MMFRDKRLLVALAAFILSIGVPLAANAAGDGGHGAGEDLGSLLPLWSVIPFAGILLSIALFPILAPRFWHHHFAKVSMLWSLALAVPFVIAYHGEAVHEILHIFLADYIPFIILLWSLFTISGGILIQGTLAGTPLVNTAILLIGTLLASWIGTTGAAMLLIRPLLRANQDRKRKVHVVVFFIFLVANIGGSLTPLGDPPLLLGFLHGVPFFWTLRLIKEFGFVASILLVLFYLIDRVMYSKESGEGVEVEKSAAGAEQTAGDGRLRVLGLHNIIFLAGVLGSVLMSSVWKPGTISILGVEQGFQSLLRDVLLIIMGLLSLKFTSKKIREDNEFSWFPIVEVAYLFAGIFMTIIPALAILRAGEHGALAFLIEAVKTPRHYYWVTGLLSSFLDNAPTYLTFLNTALGSFFSGMAEKEAIAALIAQKEVYLVAISIGAVFMGANTYIGNAPNFMVKSIAEESGVKMPSFFGYMLYSTVILIPLYALVTIIFL